MTDPKKVTVDFLIRQNGPNIIDFITQDSFETTIYTDIGMFLIQYKQWEKLEREVTNEQLRTDKGYDD